ncbi:MAG: hypothetical protein RLZZ373_234 [Pseudomonadota bacterium]
MSGACQGSCCGSSDPRQPQPQRRLYASAHTVLRRAPQAAVVRGDPQRPYLNLGDRLRIWARESEDLAGLLLSTTTGVDALVAEARSAFAYGEWLAKR